jgi:hypothetical protein
VSRVDVGIPAQMDYREPMERPESRECAARRGLRVQRENRVTADLWASLETREIQARKERQVTEGTRESPEIKVLQATSGQPDFKALMEISARAVTRELLVSPALWDLKAHRGNQAREASRVHQEILDRKVRQARTVLRGQMETLAWTVILEQMVRQVLQERLVRAVNKVRLEKQALLESLDQ